MTEIDPSPTPPEKASAQPRTGWRSHVKMPAVVKRHPRVFSAVAAVILLPVVAVIGFNIAMTNPKIATPTLNWALKTFGNQEAGLSYAKLRGMFSTTYDMQGLAWPGLVQAKDLHVQVNYLGPIFGQPAAQKVTIADALITVEPSKDEKPSTFRPQKYVDEIDAKNIDLRFQAGGKPRKMMIHTAAGSFSKGTARADATTGNNRITFDGLGGSLFGSELGGHITAKGQNMKELAEVVGATAPDTPPFNIEGRLASREKSWEVSAITGRLGDSDIAGKVAIDLGQKKPYINAVLTSRELDFDDLGVVFGIPIGADKGETMNAEQKKAKAVADRSSRLIPDARIDFARLKAVNADFSVTAVSVKDAPAGIKGIKLVGALKDQVLDFTDAHVDMAAGVFDAKVKIDARTDPAKTKATGGMRGARLQTLLGTPFIRGDANGVFNLNLTGSGFREAAASATGEVGAWSNNSELSKLAVEGAGLDLGELLLVFTNGNKKNEYVKSRCLAVQATVRDGIVTLNPAVLDNNDSLIAAKGGLNLKTEGMDIEIEAHPKDVSIGTLKGNLEIKGTLRNPRISLLDADTGFQAALIALAAPLAALLSIELGGEDDAPCGQLLAEAKSAGDGKLKKAAPAKAKGSP